MKTVAAGQTHQANEAIEQILATLANARPTGRTSPAAVGLRQQQIVSRIAREFHVPEQDLRDRLAELRRVKRGSPRKDLAAQQPPSGAPIQLPAWERELVELLLTSADAIEQLADRILPEDVQHTLARNIYEQCLRLHETGKTVELSSLSVCFDDRRIKSLLVQLDEHACAKRRSDIAQRVSDLVREIQRRQHEAEVQSQRARILHGNLSQEQEVEALNDLLAHLRSRQAGSAPTDG